jgi:hypothetical protein
MDSRDGTPSLGWVAPFGDPRIEACSRLPGAFRSVPRPSSPLDAKASTRCPSLARPAPAAAPPGRRVAYPCQVPDAPARDRHRQSARPPRDQGGPQRPASTTPPHDVKGTRAPPTRRRTGPPARGRAGGPRNSLTADRPWGMAAPPRRDGATPSGVVGPGRLERPTSRLSGVRSDRLSYGPAPDARGGRRGGLGEGTGGRRGPACDAPRGRGLRGDLRKEVIQPQVPLRLPCYDFTPVADLTVDGCLRASAVSPPASGRANSHGVTGGVYKARERIHRGVLIRDY